MTRPLDPDQPVGSTRTLVRADEGGLVRRTVLPGGLRVVTEAMPTVRSASVGIWIGVGSYDEAPALAGASHFLEHLLFKGTRRRSALDISIALEEVGGEMNAFTAKEYTCYHGRVLDTDLPLAIDVLVDMVTSSTLAAADIEAERDVILEEIAMNDDDPDDVVHNLINTQLWGDGPLGRPISGPPANVAALTRAQIAGYYRRRYRPENMVVSVAGNVDHATVVRQVRRAFEAAGALDGEAVPLPPRSPRRSPGFGTGAALVSRPLEQANLVLGLPGVPRRDNRRHAAGVLNAAVGGGMSSRLFQEVREKRSLAYSVYSFATQYADAGMLGVYAGCAPGRIDEVLEVCHVVLGDVAKRGISDDELRRAKGQVTGGIVLGLEDSGSRMSRIGRADLVSGELPSIDELLARVEAVTLDDVGALATDLLGAESALAVVGPFAANRFG